MRVIIYGMGAVGGVIAAALARSGTEVIGIARGAMLEAVQAKGLRLRAVDLDETVPVACVAAPDQIDFRADDIILLAMKTQDTLPALLALLAAGVIEQPIFCFQNGVENERLAARFFPNVHGAIVMMPATYLVPGEVAVFGTPHMGVFDLGLYPRGQNADDQTLAQALDAGGMVGVPCDDVMDGKYGKLLMNLRNILQAALGAGVDQGDLVTQVQDEARAVYAAAGITARIVDESDPRRGVLMRSGAVAGVERSGGSTLQSLSRGTGALETDYLNGEIVWLGRLHGVATPLNVALTRLARQLAQEGAAPGSLTLEELTRILTT